MTAPYVGSTTNEPMGGIELAKGYVCTYLQETLPPTIQALQGLLNIAPASPASNLMPTPDLYLPYEPPALDASNLATKNQVNASALLYVSCMDTSRLQEISIDAAGNPFYDFTYPINVVVWIKGQAWQATIQARNNLMLAVRTAILRAPGLLQPIVTRVDVNTWRERAAEPETVDVSRGDRHIAGGVISFNLVVRETLLLPPIGTAEEYNVDVEVLPKLDGLETPFRPPPHPALD